MKISDAVSPGWSERETARASQEREKELCKAWEDRMEERAIRASIEAYRELDLPEADIKMRVKEKYGLTGEEAGVCLAR